MTEIGSRVPESKIEEYWDWLASALFLLLSVDLLTTLYAAHVVGIEAEWNPLTRWLLGEGNVVLVGANLLAAVLVVSMFWGLIEQLRVSPSRLQGPFAFAIELWLGTLLTLGLAVFANNVMVIVAGVSLF